MNSTFRRAVPLVWALALLACQGAPAPAPGPQGSALTVADIEVGRSIAADKTIADRTSTFSPGDTFYVAVNTTGSSPRATLSAVWTYGGDQRITESTQTIAPSGPAVTEFHLSRPVGPGEGWPAGQYEVAIALSGVSAGTRQFKVE